MVANIIIWSFMFVLCYLIGAGTITLFERLRWFNLTLKENTPIDYVLLIGFSSITTFLAYFSIFSKIGAVANLVLLTLSLAILFTHFRKIKKVLVWNIQHIYQHYSIWAIALSFVLLASALFSIISVGAYDTGLYHAQSIKWIESYKAVPGLGNLHDRFAFNSHFFLPSALFNMGSVARFLGVKATYYPVNSFLYLLLVFRLILNIAKAIKHNHLFQLVFSSTLLYFSFTDIRVNFRIRLRF